MSAVGPQMYCGKENLNCIKPFEKSLEVKHASKAFLSKFTYF